MDSEHAPSQEFLLNACCSRCGYDLRSNNVAGPCPKCGLQISYASFNSGLANANPIWLSRIYLGVTGILIANALFLVEVVTELLDVLSGRQINQYFYSWWTQLHESGFAVEWFSALFLIAAVRENNEPQLEKVSPRKVLLAVGAAWVAIYFLHRLSHPLNRSAAKAFWVILILTQIAATAALFHYLNYLAHRIGDPFLRRHVPLSMTISIISIGFGFMIGLQTMYMTRSSWERTQDVQYLLASAGTVYFLVILRHLRKSLRDVLYQTRSDPARDSAANPD